MNASTPCMKSRLSYSNAAVASDGAPSSNSNTRDESQPGPASRSTASVSADTPCRCTSLVIALLRSGGATSRRYERSSRRSSRRSRETRGTCRRADRRQARAPPCEVPSYSWCPPTSEAPRRSSPTSAPYASKPEIIGGGNVGSVKPPTATPKCPVRWRCPSTRSNRTQGRSDTWPPCCRRSETRPASRLLWETSTSSTRLRRHVLDRKSCLHAEHAARPPLALVALAQGDTLRVRPVVGHAELSAVARRLARCSCRSPFQFAIRPLTCGFADSALASVGRSTDHFNPGH